jgi:hypothetical protein
MNASVDDPAGDRTFWRGMYLIAFVIGVVVPIAAIIAAGTVTAETAWRSVEVPVPTDEARGRNDVNWRQERVPAPKSETSNHTDVNWINEARAYERRPVQGPLLLLGLAWSGATLIGIAGVASGGWIIQSTGERLGIDRSRRYVRGMFLMALAMGALVPLAGVIAAGVITADSPSDISTQGTSLLFVMWCGMIAVSIAGVLTAAWLVKTAATKLGQRPLPDPLVGRYEPRYFADVESVR